MFQGTLAKLFKSSKQPVRKVLGKRSGRFLRSSSKTILAANTELAEEPVLVYQRGLQFHDLNYPLEMLHLTNLDIYQLAKVLSVDTTLRGSSGEMIDRARARARYLIHQLPRRLKKSKLDSFFQEYNSLVPTDRQKSPIRQCPPRDSDFDGVLVMNEVEDRSTRPISLCATHSNLNYHIIHDIFSELKNEITICIDKLRKEPAEVHPMLRSTMAHVHAIREMWVGGEPCLEPVHDILTKTSQQSCPFKSVSLCDGCKNDRLVRETFQSNQYYQENQCEACILSRIGSCWNRCIKIGQFLVEAKLQLPPDVPLSEEKHCRLLRFLAACRNRLNEPSTNHRINQPQGLWQVPKEAGSTRDQELESINQMHWEQGWKSSEPDCPAGEEDHQFEEVELLESSSDGDCEPDCELLG